MAGIFSYASADSIQMSSKPLRQFKVIAARVIGAQGEPDNVGALDAIHMALDRLNEYEWEYLTVRGADIPVTAGTSTYELPTLYKKPLSLRFNARPLMFIRRADYDKVTYADMQGYCTHYSLFNSQLSGNFELLPTPNEGGTVEIRFYRPITKPTGDDEVLDIVQWMERAVILQAQAQLLLEHGDDMGKYDRLQRLADKALEGALGVDRTPGPQEDTGFTPYTAWGNRSWPTDHAYNYIEGLE